LQSNGRILPTGGAYIRPHKCFRGSQLLQGLFKEDAGEVALLDQVQLKIKGRSAETGRDKGMKKMNLEEKWMHSVLGKSIKRTFSHDTDDA